MDPSRRASGYSTDGGATVTRFVALARGTAPSDMLFGNLAVSANDNDNLVWVPSNLSGMSSKIYYTTDRGESWDQADLTGLNAKDALHPKYNMARHILAADPQTPGTFYALGHDVTSGSPVLWTSSTRGAHWTKVATTGLVNPGGNGFRYNPTLIHDGTTLWAVPGDGGIGVFCSSNGTSWLARDAISDAQRLGVGASMPGSSSPTLFTFGTVGGVQGMYLSRDRAVSWEHLCSDPIEIYAGIRHIAGDSEVPGKVYVGLGGGNGFAVGEF
jgi:hypothetical protein